MKISSDSNPLVFIVIVNWNGWTDTISCLKSLEKTSYPNFQIIVVDNASTDDSVERIRSAFPIINIYENAANNGFGAGNNAGIRLAFELGADFIWLLNNDTLPDSQALYAMVEVAMTDSLLGAVGCVLRYMDHPERIQAWGGGQVNLLFSSSRHHLGPVPPNKLHFLTAASVLMSRVALESVGIFDEGFFMYWEDVDLSFRIRRMGFKLAVAEKAQVLHRESSSTKSNLVSRDNYYSFSSARFLQKHVKLPTTFIFVSMIIRVFFRLIRGQYSRALAVYQGSVRGKDAFKQI